MLEIEKCIHSKLTHVLLCVCLSFRKTTPVVTAPPTPAAVSVTFEGLSKTKKMKVKWAHLGLVFFLLVSLVMTGCFLWQYQLPKLQPGKTAMVSGHFSLKYLLCLQVCQLQDKFTLNAFQENYSFSCHLKRFIAKYLRLHMLKTRGRIYLCSIYIII